MYGYDIFYEQQMELLINAVREKRNPHSYIFEGETGMGKSVCAELLAAAITCQESLCPCGSCKSCLMAKAKTHPDIKHVVPEKDKKTIGVNVMRVINEDTLIKPFYSTKKVYIIDGDLLTVEAQNAFLKTLEEPPLYANFIILVSDSSKLLQTVISRCALISFSGVTNQRMKKYLEDKFSSQCDSMKFYINYAEGNPGRLHKLIESPEFSILRDECYKAVLSILSNEYYDAFQVSDMFDKRNDEIEDVLETLLLFLRDVLLIQEGQNLSVINSDYVEKLRKLASYADEAKVMKAIECISLCAEMNKRNIGAKYIGMYLSLKVKEEEN